jgi:rhamnose utilization protein RhaD (predicted bifunctional aldolase and dehydrogenase)
MRSDTQVAIQAELQELLELTERLGSNPLLTQASTGNTSMKLDGVLWIKASGKWMADALQEDILTPLLLADVHEECLQRNVDPAGRYPDASLETAMHAVLPHRVVVHVHCVNTIAWAVRSDARTHLQECLDGLRWHWIPYVASGLPLSREIQGAFSARGGEVFVLGNHGLVIAGEYCKEVESLLGEVGRRLAIRPRQAHPADYTALAEISEGSPWDLPDDDTVHALGTDKVSQAVLSGGLLYPCQAIFSKANTPAPFRAIPCPDSPGQGQSQYRDRSFLMIEGRGVLLSKSLTPAERAMLSGLAQVVQRIPASAPLRYLTEAEIAMSSSTVAYRYRELASERLGSGAGVRALSRQAPGESLAS